MDFGAKLAALGFSLAMITPSAVVLADGASLDEASKEQSVAAQKAFEAADVLYDAKHYAEALSAFRTSHDVVKSPNARLMIARCLRELGRLGEAYSEAEAALAEAEAVSQSHPRYAETAKAAREDLKALKARVGFVKVDLGSAARDGLAIKIGERSFAAQALNEPIALTPGKTAIVVTSPGQKEYRRDIVMEAGSTQTVKIDSAPAQSMDGGDEPEPEPAEPAAPSQTAGHVGPDSSMRTWAYVAGGAGAIGLATFGVFGLLNNSSFSTLEDDCPNGRCPPGRNGDIDAGRRYQLIANIGLGVGIAGIAAGTTLFVLSAKQPSAEQPRTALRLGPAAVSLEGRF